MIINEKYNHHCICSNIEMYYMRPNRITKLKEMLFCLRYGCLEVINAI
uniref:Uncharacterized protein n=1 Tax=Parascaris univalens TaxID=6257 RepID=A0A915BRG6_PARUN